MNFHHYAVVFSKIKKFQLIFVFLKFFSLQINLYDLLQFLPPARLGLQNISSASRLCPTHWKYQYLKDQYLKIPMSERPISENYILKNTNIWKTSGTDLQIQICSDPPNIVRYGLDSECIFSHSNWTSYNKLIYFLSNCIFIKTKKLIQYFTLYVIIYNLILVILWKDLIIKNLKNDPEERIRIHIPIDSEDPHSATATATAT